ncbi:uncharacterized protein LOC111870813 isoform X4 [Cryptotermes secundus]|nr:uncharacterized protein LOC111870813 isoform X4 [Cryptotermes secundus]
MQRIPLSVSHPHIAFRKRNKFFRQQLLCSNRLKEIPTVTIVEIPNRVTCPFCSGVSSDCPLSTNPAYLYAHPPPAYQPPPDYSSLVFQEIPKLQQTFPSPDSAPSFDHPKRYSLGCKYSTSF